jgi:hypothetical protein
MGCELLAVARKQELIQKRLYGEVFHLRTDQRDHWCADCCLATSYKHSSYSCLRVSRSVYGAIIWQWSYIVGTPLS